MGPVAAYMFFGLRALRGSEKYKTAHMISRSDWEPLPTPTLSPFCTRVPFSVSVFTAAVWCVPALRVPLVHSLIRAEKSFHLKVHFHQTTNKVSLPPK